MVTLLRSAGGRIDSRGVGPSINPRLKPHRSAPDADLKASVGQPVPGRAPRCGARGECHPRISKLLPTLSIHLRRRAVIACHRRHRSRTGFPTIDARGAAIGERAERKTAPTRVQRNAGGSDALLPLVRLSPGLSIRLHAVCPFPRVTLTASEIRSAVICPHPASLAFASDLDGKREVVMILPGKSLPACGESRHREKHRPPIFN
jgi:hypothetical protein